MARNARRAEQVSVAELLVRSAATRERYRFEDTVILPRSRHREKSPALRALARTRVFSVVAGALALAGGVATAATSVSGPVQRSSELVWPPLDAGLPMVAATPNYPGGTGGAGKTPVAPDFGEGVGIPNENAANPPGSASDSGGKPGHGKAAKLAKNIKKVKDVGQGVGKAIGKATAPGQLAKTVRHDIPEVPVWISGRPRQQVQWALELAQQAGGAHCDHGGGGRHRR
jgi:hypothetical protein